MQLILSKKGMSTYFFCNFGFVLYINKCVEIFRKNGGAWQTNLGFLSKTVKNRSIYLSVCAGKRNRMFWVILPHVLLGSSHRKA